MLVTKLTTLLDNCLTVNQAKEIHAHILVNALNHLEPLLVRQIALSSSSYSSGLAQYLKLIIYQSQHPDTFSWGCTIRFFSQHGRFKEAFSLYVQMQRLGLRPSTFAVSSALRACARVVDKIGGVSVHGQVHKYGFRTCVYVQTALVDFHSKLGEMVTARKVFDEMGDKNVVSWNSILSGYLKSGDLAEAHTVFDEIPRKDVISWNSLISGYARVGNMDQACCLFQQMPEKNSASWNSMIGGFVDCGNIESARSLFDALPQRNNVSWITMIGGYSKCGDVESARELFDQMDKNDLLSYNAMIACYAQNSQAQEAIQLFNQMLKPDVNVQPDRKTLASVISASSQLGDSELGSLLESYMHKFGIELDDHLATAFVDFYAKCGSIDKAYELFCGIHKRDLIAYSAMILGFGINGKVVDAVNLFEEMINAHVSPNLVTYTGLLTAYNHAGMVEEGYQCFNSMKNHGLEPSADHYGIMVDLLGRAGRLEEAYKLIRGMPMQAHAGVWGALLLACRLHQNVELGEIAAQQCFQLEPDTTGYSSLLASIYASVERWDDAKRLRKVVGEKGFSKVPGCSWMEAI